MKIFSLIKIWLTEWRSWGCKLVLVATDNPDIYREIRIKIKEDINEETVLDLFPEHPYIFSTDMRLSSMAIVSKNIYKMGVDGNVAEAGIFRGGFCKIY